MSESINEELEVLKISSYPLICDACGVPLGELHIIDNSSGKNTYDDSNRKLLHFCNEDCSIYFYSYMNAEFCYILEKE